MNRSLGVQKQFDKEADPNLVKGRAVVLNLLQLFETDTNLGLAFSQAFEFRQFHLGDQLSISSISAPSTTFVQTEHNIENFHVICQGRVRLLGFDATQGREVSTLLLETGETFGAENLLYTKPIVTQAIAASAGFVAQISADKLQPWLERLPNLRDYLLQQVVQRQRLIFFKTATDWRSLTSHQLRQLVPYIGKTNWARRGISSGNSRGERLLLAQKWTN
jgi:ATP-binding cassette subfamily B protein